LTGKRARPFAGGGVTPCAAAILALLALGRPAQGQEAPDFARDIRPILAATCFECHGSEKQESGLQLDVGRLLLAGGNSGPAVIAGKPSESLLIEAINGGGERITKMPPKGKPLESKQVDLVKRWIEAGAKVPDESTAGTGKRASGHWAFQPIADPMPPAIGSRDWPRNAIDYFVSARLDSAGLAPSPEASRETLIRRLTLDLVGLPPTVEEVEAFVGDQRSDAYEHVVDGLLASPHYGERWGRQWLDTARYADSNGYTIDGARSIWKYRDWVIQALNRNLPFDQFAIEQLAGDLLPGASTDQMIATGFHRNTPVNEEGGTDPEQFRVEAVVDRVSTTGAAFLGLTLGCARCHDHKYDPISQREFYQLFAVFNSADEPILSVPTQQQAKEMPALVAEIEQSEKRLAQVDDNSAGRQAYWEMMLGGQNETAATLAPAVREAVAVASDARTAEQKELLKKEFQKVDPERVPLAARIVELKESRKQLAAAITTTLVLRERKEPRSTHIHLRGDFLHPGAQVTPGVPAILPPIVSRGPQPDRLDFARWLFDPGHPLTARVTVNRIWQVYFGQGLVATENDFGLQGEAPSHPELLDWLAKRLIESGWDLKAVHRLIVTSATYRQASRPRPELVARDPYNKLLGRQVRLRLEAESIRDAALAASGLLSREIGGPGVYPPQPQGIYRFTQQVKFWGESKNADRFRRGLYTYFWRSSPYPFLKTFDAPDAVVACTRRPRSNTPLQALTLANDHAFFEIAQGFAATLSAQPASDRAEQIRLAFRRSLAREPSAGELAGLIDYYDAEQARFEAQPEEARQVAPAGASAVATPAQAAAWTMLARVLLNLDEFITRE
jgi:mono/diheme cytochrome c family protein